MYINSAQFICFRLSSFIVYLLTFLSMAAYLIAMECRSLVAVYIAIVALGFVKFELLVSNF